jgi:hypothetical protein
VGFILIDSEGFEFGFKYGCLDFLPRTILEGSVGD